MIGVALVTFASIFAAGAKATINGAIDKNLKSAFVVQNTDGFSPFSPEVLRSVDRVDGVSSVSGVRFSEAKVARRERQPVGRPRSTRAPSPTLYKLDMKQGGEAAVRDLGPGDVLVKKGYADSHDTKLGDTLQVTTPSASASPRRSSASSTTRAACWPTSTVTNASRRRSSASPRTPSASSGADPGADQAAVKQQISQLLDAATPRPRS